MTEAPDVAARRPGVGRSLVALLLGAAAVLLAHERMRGTMLLRGSPTIVTGVIVGVALLALLVARTRRGRLEPILAALALAAAAICIAGVIELPSWPSIESFGRSPLLFLVVLTVIGTALAWIPASPHRSLPDVGLGLFVVFSACGGPLFVRQANEFAALIVLLVVIAALTMTRSEARPVRSIPFLRWGLLFAAASLVPIVTAVDFDRHLVGWSGVVIGLFPLLALGRGPADARRARFALNVFAAMVLVVAASAFLIVLETGYHFDLDLALQARLPLFGEHPNIIAPYFAVAPPILVALLLGARTWTARVLLLLTLGMDLCVLALTRSRASFLGAAVGIGAIVALFAAVQIYRWRPSKRIVAAMVAVVVVVGLVGFLAVKDQIGAKAGGESMQFRIYLWKTAVAAIADRPLLGFGFLTGDPLMAYAEPSFLDYRSKDTHPHNLLIAIGLGSGLLGLAAFVALVAAFLGRTLAASARLTDRGDRVLAIGVVSSALALFAANLLDQGLSLNTPFPLHLALLIGVGSLLVRAASPEQAPVRTRSSRLLAAATATSLAAVAIYAIAGITAQRLSRAASSDLQNGDEVGSIRKIQLAYRIHPLALETAVRRFDIMYQTKRLGIAEQTLERLRWTHPMSAIPLDRLSIMRFDAMRWLDALDAVERARALDPTGPLTGEWALRAGRVYVMLGNKDACIRELANAFRYDYKTATRLPWIPDSAGGWRIHVAITYEPIYFGVVLNENRKLLPEMIQSDPINARRLATTLCQNYMHQVRFDLAREVIAEYERFGGPTWLPLQYLMVEMQRSENAGELARQAAEQDTPESDARVEDEALPSPEATVAATAAMAAADDPDGAGLVLATPADEDAAEPGDEQGHSEEPIAEANVERIVGLVGESGVYLATGRRLLGDGKPDEALVEFHRAIATLYDIVAEKEYIALVLASILDAHIERNDVDAAAAALRPALYFHGAVDRRIALRVKMAQQFREAERHDEALAQLTRACRMSRMLHPGKQTNEQIRNVADALVPYLRRTAPTAHQKAAKQALAVAITAAPGWLIEIRALREIGQSKEARASFEQFRARFPEWTRAQR